MIFFFFTATKQSAFLRVHPKRWLMEGTSVTMTCQVLIPSSDWKFYWYRVVASGEGITVQSRRSGSKKKFSVQLLTNRESLGSYNLSSAGPQHSGVYVCQGERGGYHTEYSSPQPVWVTSESFRKCLIVQKYVLCSSA